MALDSSRPGTSNGGVTSITSAAGIRCIRAMASESWDEDFLWQHSSSSDLHLPSTASRHTHQHRHSLYRDKRLSTASSSSEYYAPRTQVPYHAQARPHRKASSLSTSTMGSATTQDEALPPSRTRLSRSASDNQSQRDTEHLGENWASLSTTSLPEEEDEATITLAAIASRQTAISSSNALTRQSHSSSPSNLASSPNQSSSPSKLSPPSPSFFRTASSSSWRSMTPSLASDTCSAAHTSESASATESDNETVEEGDNDEDNTGNWEHLSLSPDGQSLAASAGETRFGQGSSLRRKRGRGNTFGTTTPRLALSTLFSATAVPSATSESTEGTPLKRLGASFFRRNSRVQKGDSPSPSLKPVSSTQRPPGDIDRSRSPVLRSGEQTPTLHHRELVTSHKKEDRTVRARQSTGASSNTSTSLFSASQGGKEQDQLSPGRLTSAIGRKGSLERTPRSCNTAEASGNCSYRSSRIRCDLSLSDRLRFDVEGHTDQNQERSILLPASTFLGPSRTHQADRSTTSLVSNQSNTTSTSASWHESRVELTRQASMTRRKLKKIRPQTADASLVSTSCSTRSPVLTAGDPSMDSSPPPQTAPHGLSPSFAFPPSPSRETANLSHIRRSPAVSIRAETGSSTSETASASSMRRINSSKKNKKLSIGSSLRRKVSKRKVDGEAEESSADENAFLNTRRGSLDKLVSQSILPISKITDQPVQSSSSAETWKPVFSSTTTIKQLQNPVAIEEHDTTTAHGSSVRETILSDSEIQHMTGFIRGNRLLAGLSKRMSRDFRAGKDSPAGPERKRSFIFARIEQESTSSAPLATSDAAPQTLMAEAGPPMSQPESPPISVKKHKRPLSLSGFLSRSTGPNNSNRSRSSTLAKDSEPQPARPTDYGVTGPALPPAPLSASIIGGFRRPSGFLHRSTASSGNIPTAKALLETSGVQTSKRSSDSRRTSLEMSPRPLPVLHHRRSFNPLWRSATATVPEERPQSSLSLLAETSIVRPLSMLPTAVSTATITTHTYNMKQEIGQVLDSPPIKPRQRHLPSLSLTLVPSAMTSTPTKSAGASFPVLSPRTMQRTHSENPCANSQTSSHRSQYFTAASPTNGTITPISKSVSRAKSPGYMTRNSDDSDGSVNIVRRVSLSDLKIPQRISNAQAKIGQDLKRVKEFKEGVEELKRLRRVYRGLVPSDPTPGTLSPSADSSYTTSDGRAEASPSPPPIPTDTTARFDNLMARVAVDYQKWWEIADVLIKLADGAEEEEDNESSYSYISNRERCKSEITASSASPPSRTLELPHSPQVSNQPDDMVTHLNMGSSISLQRHKKGRDTDDVDEIREERSFVSLSPPLQTFLSTPTQRRLPPHLSRSHSTSSLTSPTSSPATPARSASHSTSISIAGITRDFSHNHRDDTSASLSERQLNILRGMLNPHLPLSPKSPVVTRPAENAPARTPSITSISPRSHLFANGLASLSPFTSRDSRPQSSGSTISSINTSPSSFISPLRRRRSVKKGHVVITSVQSFQDEEGGLTVRESSPIPDSPPFHVSGMLPTPPPPSPSDSAPLSPEQVRPHGSRSTSGQTTSIGADTTGSLSSNKSPPATPIIRKGRLRQASRAGMLGIRDFLKNFNAKKTSNEGSTALDADGADTSIVEAFLPIAGDENALRQDNGHFAKVPSVAQTDSLGLTKASEPANTNMREMNAAEESVPPLCSSTTTSPRSPGSSDEEEDWDKRSSDDEAEARIPRFDTQATANPLSLCRKLSTVHISTPPGTGISTSLRRISTSPDAGSSSTLSRQGMTEIMAVRGRTESATSTASRGTVVHTRSPSARPATRSTGINIGTPESSLVKSQQSKRQKASFSASTSVGTKLALTSEAMPALLAKVTEVKQHCATCVTELRNVTV